MKHHQIQEGSKRRNVSNVKSVNEFLWDAAFLCWDKPPLGLSLQGARPRQAKSTNDGQQTGRLNRRQSARKNGGEGQVIAVMTWCDPPMKGESQIHGKGNPNPRFSVQAKRFIASLSAWPRSQAPLFPRRGRLSSTPSGKHERSERTVGWVKRPGFGSSTPAPPSWLQ